MSRPTLRAVLAAAVLCAFPAPVASASTVDLAPDWQVVSSAIATDPGDGLSQPGYSTTGWLPVKTNDANAVGTEVAAQLQNTPASAQCGADNIFYGENITACQGPQPSDAHGLPGAPYNVPWWFRTEFTPNLQPGQAATLEVRGIMGQADLWVNGTQVATRAELQGSEPEYTFDITSLIKPGANALALKLYPNDPGAMLTQDFNDWTQTARDQNTGLKYPVRLHVANALQLSDAHVNQKNADDMSSSDLTVKGTVENTTQSPQAGDVDATISSPGGGADIKLHQALSLAAGETKTVTFDPVHLDHPKLWWPYQMGDQPLYGLSIKASQSGATSDVVSKTFGIRTVKTWLSAPGTRAYNGSRWFSVNGKPFVFRGGGMMDQDMFLRYSKERLSNEIALIKAMGLNGLRLEGDDQPDSFYDEMDKAGLLVYGGYLCCNFWEEGSSWTAKDQETNYRTALTLGRQQRDHPSVIFWSWSDNTPAPAQEAGAIQGFKDADFDIPLIASAEYKSTSTLGPSGMKEGPYNWFPPSYAYSLNCSGSSGANPCTSGAFVNRGGAWAFETEASPGSTVPTKDSLDRFMPPAAQTQMVTSPNLRLFNSGTGSRDSGTSYSSFQHIGVLATAVCRRYGTWTAAPVTCPTNPPGATGLYANSPSINDFVRKGQALNYESVRAQFEAYIDHSTRTDSPSTGLVYWMMNKPMPSLLWNLYNYDYDQSGTYFGAKKANSALHVYYSYAAPESDPGNRQVNVANLTGHPQNGLTVTARTYDMTGKVLDSKDAWNIHLPSQGVMNQLFTIPNPTLPDVNGVPQRTYFLELLLKRGTKVIDRNVYWLSTVNDVPAYSGSAYPNLSTYGDLRNLQTPAQDPINGLLPMTTLDACATTRTAGGATTTDVTLTNRSSTVAFLARVDVRRGTGSTPDAGDNQVRPATYSDNFVTLWPGQSQTVTETYAASALGARSPVVSVGGYNVTAANIAGSAACAPPGGVESLGLANGDVPVGGATPGQDNTPEAMAAAKAQVKVGKLDAKDGTAGGTVPATLSLALGAPASFGAFTPGVGGDYTASTKATVISTAGDATLSYSDPGHMTNGAFSLPQPLVVELSKSAWTEPVSNDTVAIAFKQRIDANDALRTGSYSKTLTFTLSTTNP
ncbi:glycoside hydrolase family 2 protein [Candidatus Solirubrobacter pratensis]|uniref:glycoside hydrolase family 2 protein n=1 Tax=Candidatus Solirubrobacter pratensis TaxID=1298857 RepID=UPI00041C61E7|nr:glycoside hydrolase family 2 TIM barrel-domain containing protein [Candidatus Solirubrobacter pratensis]